MFIVFEGLEGVGKTTLGKRVSKKIGATYIKSPPPEMNPVRGFIADSLNPHANFYFYLTGLFLLQGHIEVALTNGPVIVDRYIDSTVAYHDFGNTLDSPAFATDKIRQPDIRVVVTCPEDQRMKRISIRGHHIFERKESNEKLIEQFLVERADLIFENTDLIDESTTKLSSILKNLLC